MASIQSNESVSLNNEEQSQVNRLIEKAVEISLNSSDDVALLANIITKSDVTVVEELVNLIKDVETEDQETNISLQVLSSVATLQSQESIVLDNDKQSQVNRLIEEAVDRAEDSNEDSELLANVITKSDVSVITEVVSLIQKTEEDDSEINISLKVLSSIVSIQTDESIVLDTEEQTQVNRLIKEALERANEEEDDALLENIIKNDENIIEEIIYAIEEEDDALLENIIENDENIIEEIIYAIEEEAEEEQEAEAEAEQEEAEQEEAEEEAEQEEAEEEYDANGFSFTTPFLHRDTGTEYNMYGFNSDGYNDQGFNENGDYNEIYDTNVSEN